MQKNIIPILTEHDFKANSILVELFQECNLKCEFCGSCNQNDQHQYRFDVDQIKKFPDMIARCLPLMRQDGKFGVGVLGGELFQDRYDYTVYDWLFDQLTKLLKPYPKARLYTFSNMLFRDHDRVYDLLSHHNVYLNASFDLVGRYTKPYMVPRVMQNIDFFKTRVLANQTKLAVCITAHRKNIEAIMTQGENYETFLKLYNDPLIKIEFGDYLPLKSVPQYSIDTDLITKFYLYMLEHFPRLTNFNIIDESRDSKNRCKEIYVSQLGIHGCYSSVNDKSVVQYQKLFADHMQCYQCEYFQRCSKMCYRAYAYINRCWKKQVYNILLHND